MTNKLYYSNPHLKEWNATVTEIIPKDDKYYVVLDQTAFYPEGGGQPSDRGFIDNLEVLDVVEIDNNIFHILPQKPLSNTVCCQLDFERRLDFMQQHSGQHLLSSVFYNLYNAHTNSFHMGENYVSIDLSIADITNEMVKKTEIEINNHIFMDLPVKQYMITKAACEALPLRKIPTVDEDIRIVEIDNIDFSPCCGTHVSRTGEIGLIKIVKTEKNKGMTRVYFKCGLRALLDFQGKQEIIQSLISKLSTSEDDIIGKIESDSAILKNAQKEIKALKEIAAGFEADQIVKDNTSKTIVKNFEDKGFADIQMLAEQIIKKGELLIIAASLNEMKLLAYSSLKDSINLNIIFKENLQRFSAKGGGSDKKAQASFENIEQLISFENFLNEIIKV